MSAGQRPYRLMISAGEASGDAHAAHALLALMARGVAVTAFGMGGASLESAGMEIVVDSRELSVIGIVDVLIRYPMFKRRLRELQRRLLAEHPDLLVIVDYPDFNLRLAKTARQLGIPVLFYISPQVWAWRAGRIRTIGQRISHMAVLFPFEVEVYRNAGIPVTFVGHPLVDDARSSLSPAEARRQFGVPLDGPLVTLLPGSRGGEIARHLPVMCEAARRLLERHPRCRFLLPVASGLDRSGIESRLDPALPIELVDGQACDAMRAADVVLTSSGTATLETALIGTPMIVMYIVSSLNYLLMRHLIRIDDIALVNIVAGERIVEEYLQDEASADALAQALHRLLSDPEACTRQRDALATVKQRMGAPGASERVAALLQQLLQTGEH